ncbi:hypothetical protein Val02_79350 [Virgisporangium aliadipatigenens]|uniref:Glycerophosphoryl diester phosphodiesterase membrane domain-containing protein n=1 Tax=Virgisporangium aliadipatigenens TaxID=741659 RepID=A0A8J3YSI5_9ACTN|nr:hypothetical protein [Virgisporangium aliadipatigenens]GIJ51049.1 hypothetical protein Val02_79350 [Virgisporangium aliadipatigenens]
MQAGTVPLRPLTVGELLDAAVALFRTNARPLLLVAVLLAAAEQALLYPLRIDTAKPPYMVPYDDALDWYWVMIGVGFATEALIITLLGGLTARAAGSALLGERLPPRALFAPRGSRLGWVLAVAVFFGLTAGVAALACFAPWFVVYALIGFAAPALVIDRVNPFRAVGRSVAMSVRVGLRGAGVRLLAYFGWATVRLALGFGTIGPLELLTGSALDNATVWLVAGFAWTVVNAVVYPILASLDAVLHLETRMRTEGLDIAIGRARATGRPPAAELVVT